MSDRESATAHVMNDRFGPFGGRYVPETLIPALDALDIAFDDAMRDENFRAAVDGMLRDYVGRPSILSDAPRLSAADCVSRRKIAWVGLPGWRSTATRPRPGTMSFRSSTRLPSWTGRTPRRSCL